MYVGGPNNTIGGTEPGNTIAFNAGAGVMVASSTGNTIRGNLIFSNDQPDIDLGGDGVTFNHVGLITGPNNYQNYPVLSLATSDGETTAWAAYSKSEANQTYTLEFFANDACHPTFFGGGKTFLGSFSVTTDSNGVVIFDEELPPVSQSPSGSAPPLRAQTARPSFRTAVRSPHLI